MKRLFLTIAAATIGLAATLAQGGETTNKLGITMVDIPAGSFLMGSCKSTSSMGEENKKRAFLGQAPLTANCPNVDADASEGETPQHRVSVSAFQMGKTEVTLGQFKQFIVAAGRSDLVNYDFIKYNTDGDDAPVVWVSWSAAHAFIAWLNKTGGGGYRLPSEAEWEYACRAGGNHTYCGGDYLDTGRWGWYSDNSGDRKHLVGSKQANAFGLHDMSGNVWEWVRDCWHESYRGAPSDGSAWTRSCSGDGRVLRGGSYGNSATSSRAATRHGYNTSPDTPGNGYGFRLARTR